jgi:D-lyxose ketol-isomerase
MRWGCSCFLRNSRLADLQPGGGMCYAEVADFDRTTVANAPVIKTEDIINRGGAMVVELYRSRR